MPPRSSPPKLLVAFGGLLTLAGLVSLVFFLQSDTHGYSLAVLGPMPWVALVASRIIRPTTDVSRDLWLPLLPFGALIVSAGGLAIVSGARPGEHLPLTSYLPFAIPIALVLVPAVIRCLKPKNTMGDQPATKGSSDLNYTEWTLDRKALGLTIVMLGGGCYGYSAVAEANEILDHSVGQVHMEKVIKRYKLGGGKSGSTTYWIDVTKPGSQPPASFQIEFGRFQNLTKGDTICLRMHPGALGLAWNALEDCDRPSIEPKAAIK